MRFESESGHPDCFYRFYCNFRFFLVCGEAPRSANRHRREGSSDDDDISVVSTTNNSINGTWWFGRTTRFVPHCERRHLHDEEERPYVTPTQRKNREVAELRRQVRQGHQLLDDKDKHLAQLGTKNN